MKGVNADNIAGAVDPAAWKESIITSETYSLELIEASAVKKCRGRAKKLLKKLLKSD